jgi:hypothetical protein
MALGNVVEFVGVERDITEHKQAEAKWSYHLVCRAELVYLSRREGV